jgi:hypothetical protein
MTLAVGGQPLVPLGGLRTSMLYTAEQRTVALLGGLLIGA